MREGLVYKENEGMEYEWGMEATRKSCFCCLVSGVVQFLRMLPGLPDQMPLSSRWSCSSCEQQPVAVTQANLPDSVSWICCRKRKHCCVIQGILFKLLFED